MSQVMHGALAAAAAVGAALGACAAPGSAGTGGAEGETARATAETRVLVRLALGCDDAASAIAARAARDSGVPARYIAAAGSCWHALALRCDTAAGCSQAVERLRAMPFAYQAVESDATKRPQ